jgi:hypothetical protein
MKAGTAEPTTFPSIAPPGSNPGSVSPLGTNPSAVIVAYTRIKKVAIGCLTIHDRSREACA